MIASYMLFGLDCWCAIICTYKRLHAIFDFEFWSANICMCKQLHVIFYFLFLFLVCHCSYVQLFACTNDCKLYVIWFWFSCCAIVHMYEQLHVICYFGFGFLAVQSFACMNNCKLYFDFRPSDPPNPKCRTFSLLLENI